MDYMFLGKKGEETFPILAVRDAKSQATFATWVPAKGTEHPWVMKRVMMFIDALGYQDIILKSDQERSITAVQTYIKEKRVGQTILENNPVGDSKANGMVEKSKSVAW